MTGRLAFLVLVLALALGVTAEALLGWWALAVVGFGFGVLARSQRWSSLQFGVGIALTGAGLLAWLAWTGRPIGEMHRLLSELTSLPVLSMSLALSGVVAFCGAYLGAALGRRVLFG